LRISWLKIADTIGDVVGRHVRLFSN